MRSRLVHPAVALAALLLSMPAASEPVRAPAAKPPAVTPADVKAILAAVARPGARAVLVNVWATWCEPCREEMPDILRAFKDNKARGLRLVLVSADPLAERAEVAKYLAAHGVDFESYLKTGDDMAFINSIDPKWDGTLPASLLFDGRGQKLKLWPEKVSYDDLKKKLDEVLASQGIPLPPNNRSKP